MSITTLLKVDTIESTESKKSGIPGPSSTWIGGAPILSPSVPAGLPRRPKRFYEAQSSKKKRLPFNGRDSRAVCRGDMLETEVPLPTVDFDVPVELSRIELETDVLHMIVHNDLLASFPQVRCIAELSDSDLERLFHAVLWNIQDMPNEPGLTDEFGSDTQEFEDRSEIIQTPAESALWFAMGAAAEGQYELQIDEEEAAGEGEMTPVHEGEFVEYVRAEGYDWDGAEFVPEEEEDGPEPPPSAKRENNRWKRRKRRSARGQTAVQARWAGRPENRRDHRRREADAVAFAIVLYGLKVQQIKHFCEFRGLDFPPERTLYRHLARLGPKIVEYGGMRIAREREEVEDDDTMGIDGCWAHGRRAREGCTSGRSCTSGKIVHLMVYEGSQGGRKRRTFTGTFHKSPQAMETAGIREIARFEAQRQREDRPPLIGRLVTDFQNSAGPICLDEGWTVQHVHDPGHISKTWNSRLATHEGYRLPPMKNRRIVLRCIQPQLAKRFYEAASLAGDDADRIAFYRGAIDFFAQSDTWCFRNDVHAIEQLRSFIAATEGLVLGYQKKFHTNGNESFNALRAHLASKDTSWKTTWKPRAWLAALIFNYSYGWVEEFCASYDIPMVEGVPAKLARTTAEVLTRREKQRTPEYRLTRNASRKRHNRELANLGKAGADAIHDLPEDAQVADDVVRKLTLLQRPPRATMLFPRGSLNRNIPAWCDAGDQNHVIAVLQLVLSSAVLSGTVAAIDPFSKFWMKFLKGLSCRGLDHEQEASRLLSVLRAIESLPLEGEHLLDSAGDWLVKWQDPVRTFERFHAVLDHLALTNGTGIGSLFRIYTAQMVVYEPCKIRDLCDKSSVILLYAPQHRVPSAGASDGEWVVDTIGDAGTVARTCSVCHQVHEFAVRPCFTRLPPFLAIDFCGCTREGAAVAARAPLELRMPRADGAVYIYELFGYVRVAERHAQAHVRVGPRHFAIYDDRPPRVTYSSLPAITMQICDFISLAIYSCPDD